ncbi:MULTISPECIES: hypothetical protein [Micromonospora]|uniref:hypothetical protein n=1 Tax=Micromonospora TaxID=1873 RepID=UPI000F3B625A|nr:MULTISPECIES: hypothetical protein [Micromonospora]MBC8994129.1 hypothetical protein [Micromonospora chalcea]MCT2282023.1 hypothetical protein [Micromonospora chalcea]RNH97781.1 hypothetical protein EEZ25_29285 [Micromonospora aurantiaca]
MMHELSRLGERPFEDLCRALAVHVLGVGIQAFGDGPDGGREATFEGPLSYVGADGPWDGYGVLQAKYRRVGLGSKDADWLCQQITRELNAWLDPSRQRVSAGRHPEYLIIATNVRLSSAPSTGGIDRVRVLLRGYADRLGLKDVALWEANTLSMYLDAYPEVRQSFSHLISPADVLARTFTTLGRIDDALRPLTIQVGQGTPGNERAFRAAYQAAGGQRVLGEPTSEVYDDGPGWVQHFRGSSGQPEAVICARAGHDPVAMDAAIWDALRAASPGQLTDVGYPVRSASPAFIDGTSRRVTLDGGQWGPGEIVRRDDGSWQWQPQLRFSFETREQDRWTSTGNRMDMRLRCAARLLWQHTERAIDTAGRKRLRAALTAGPLPELAAVLARRMGLSTAIGSWERAPADEGYNDQRFASYRLRLTGESERPSLGLWVRFQLPDGLQPTIVALVDLRIDVTAPPSSGGTPSDAVPRLNLNDLHRFFTAAWTTAHHDLPLAVTANPQDQAPAGPAITELHLQAEHANTPTHGHIRDLQELIDLTTLGEPTRDSLPRMSIAVTSAPVPPMQVDDLVSDALRHMAAGFGFLEPEDDA